MKIISEINLTDVEIDKWGTTLHHLMFEELSASVRAEVRKSIKNDKDVQRIVNKMKRDAIDKMTEELK